MFDVFLDDMPGIVLATHAEASDARATTQDLADQLYDQLVRNGEGNTGLWVTFTIADHETGECIGWFSTKGSRRSGTPLE